MLNDPLNPYVLRSSSRFLPLIQEPPPHKSFKKCLFHSNNDSYLQGLVVLLFLFPIKTVSLNVNILI